MTDKEKLIKIASLADKMYYAAFNMTTDASLLRKAMKEYHQFIIREYCKEEPVSDDLEEFALQYAGHHAPYDSCWQEVEDAVKAGAKWQEKQDQSIIELAEDHAMFAGMEKMKEQMMKEAMEAKVIPADLDETQFCLSDYDEVSYITAMVKAGKLKLLDKVKVVFVKED